MVDATPVTAPSSGVSESLFPNKCVEHYSPTGPINVRLTTLYRCTESLIGPPYGQMIAKSF